mmetsp:Transcript_9529/g.13503  ORF Transcript_9529/g.13503 Transcript_9529/m.13503 type:complete len:161 (+) Transcript_9529:961-1443(+)
MGSFSIFNMPVFYIPNSIANILSLADVMDLYHVSINNNHKCFLVHIPTQGVMCFYRFNVRIFACNIAVNPNPFTDSPVRPLLSPVPLPPDASSSTTCEVVIPPSVSMFNARCSTPSNSSTAIPLVSATAVPTKDSAKTVESIKVQFTEDEINCVHLGCKF